MFECLLLQAFYVKHHCEQKTGNDQFSHKQFTRIVAMLIFKLRRH